jgi:hypothetical protein
MTGEGPPSDECGGSVEASQADRYANELHQLRNVLGVALLEACHIRRVSVGTDLQVSADKIVTHLRCAAGLISKIDANATPDG